jgi:hypothetical protein
MDECEDITPSLSRRLHPRIRGLSSRIELPLIGNDINGQPWLKGTEHHLGRRELVSLMPRITICQKKHWEMFIPILLMIIDELTEHVDKRCVKPLGGTIRLRVVARRVDVMRPHPCG